MADLADGESVEVAGSGSNRYVLKNVGGAYSCSCPAWRNQGAPIEARTCKHLKAYRGEAEELARCGASAATSGAPRAASSSSSGSSSGAKAKAKAEGPPVLLAHSWENDVDLTGWWMSEKLDGVRAYWDGTSFVSRLGNPYRAPAWFTEKLPAHPLDGELWGGRKKFQRTVSIVRRSDASDLWKEIRFVVFDAPAHDAPFEERIAHVKDWFARNPTDWAKHHDHEVCRGLAHLREELARVESLGGEGLMMRKPGSRYEVGRSSTLLKVKSFHDAEAKVVEHQKGAGRHQGRLGALVVEMPCGTRFSIGTGFSDREREDPPAIGAIVTYRYQELSEAGVPRFPSYVGVRDDVAWPPEGAAPRKAEKGSKPGAPPKARKTTDERPRLADARVVEHLAAAAPAQGVAALLVELADGKRIPLGTGLSAEERTAPPPIGSVVSYRYVGLTDSGIPRDAVFVGVRTYADEGASANDSSSGVKADTRRFELVEGTASKFWEIEVRGHETVVRFGRIGTKGQEKAKSFASPDAAARDAEKLIAEKTAKGYVEK